MGTLTVDQRREQIKNTRYKLKMAKLLTVDPEKHKEIDGKLTELQIYEDVWEDKLKKGEV